MTIAPEKLTRWLQRMVADITEEGTLHRFELLHSTEDGAERLGTYKCQRADGESEAAADLVQVIWDEAEHDAESRFGGAQRYVVLAFRREEQSDPEAQYPFRIDRLSKGRYGEATEAPTEKGERALVLRHLNDNHLMMANFAQAIGGRLSSELERETKRRQEAEDRLAKRNADFEDLQDRRLDREIDRAARLQREKLLGDVAGSLLPLLPLVVGAVLERIGPKNGHDSPLAKEMLPPPSPERQSREIVLRELFSNLTQGEIEAVRGALKPMKLMSLGQVLSSVGEAKSEAQKVALDSSFQKFLKSLEAAEVMAVLGALEQGNRNRFLLLYQSYGKAEEEAQEGLPDELRDNPPKKEDTEAET